MMDNYFKVVQNHRWLTVDKIQLNKMVLDGNILWILQLGSKQY